MRACAAGDESVRGLDVRRGRIPGPECLPQRIRTDRPQWDFCGRLHIRLRNILPGDFRLVIEQTYAVRNEPVCDAVRLAAGPVPASPPPALHLRNRVTYEAEYPGFKILLQSSDGRGGWRCLWSDHSNRIRVEAPPPPSLPSIDRRR